MRSSRLIAQLASYRIARGTSLLSVCLLLIASATSPRLPAQAPTTQSPAPPPDDAAPYVLHVYTDLLQIPTLVLSPHLQPLLPIRDDQFNISLDGGPPFHPTHIRFQDDDPLDLAILFDASGDVDFLLHPLLSNLHDFAAHTLRPHDHVSLYASDCNLIRITDDLPASDSDRLSANFASGLQNPALHHATENQPRCAHPVPLWDTLATIAKTLPSLPGRRVILAITSGQDNHSTLTWEVLKRYAAANSITIFGLSPVSFPRNPYSSSVTGSEGPFNNLTQLTGGLVLVTAASDLPLNLRHIIEMLRGRYILEFPRPTQGLPGQHSIEVTLAHRSAFIRAAGVTYPLPNPSLNSDPTTIPTPPSPAAFGDRHPLAPHP